MEEAVAWHAAGCCMVVDLSQHAADYGSYGVFLLQRNLQNISLVFKAVDHAATNTFGMSAIMDSKLESAVVFISYEVSGY